MKFFWDIPRPRKHLQLPKVISEEKILKGLMRIENIKHKAMLSLIYGCGLRRSELLDLKIKDLDGARKVIHIKKAKGNKDRIVPFGEKLRNLLVGYYQQYKPIVYLFEGMYGGRYGERSIELVMANAVKKCNV